jgi:tyrosinase
VLEGPFRKGVWALTLQTRIDKYKPMHQGTWLVRGAGNYDGLEYPVSLPTAQDIQTAMTINAYDASPYDMNVDRMMSFRNYLEGFEPPTNKQHMHNIVHDWVAGQWKVLSPEGEESIRVGTMEPLDISPSDPVFFLHHANVDRVWAQWQKHADGRMSAYVPASSAQHGWGPKDKMYPFSLFEDSPVVGSDITPESMLNFELLSYTYDDLAD